MYSGNGKYSLGKLWRQVVGKQAGRQLRGALIDGALSRIPGATGVIHGPNGPANYTGSGLYTRGKKRRAKRTTRGYKKKTVRKRSTRRTGVYGNNLMRGMGGRTNARISHIKNETGDIVIQHREYLGDVFGPAAGEQFSNQVFQLNPGLEQTFPWLSQLAPNYEEHEFKQLIFSYRSVTTDVGSSTTGQCGTIVMATNYNPDSKVFYDKGQMLEYAHAMSCKTTESMEHGVECDPKKSALSQRLFVRSGPAPGVESLKDYDIGKFQLAICNAPSAYANLPIGELWVTYTIRLSKPKLFTGRGQAISRFVCCNNNTTFTTKPTWNVPFIAGQIYVDQQNNLPMQVSESIANLVTITFPANRGGAFKIITRCRNESGQALTGNVTPPYYTIGSGNISEIKDIVSEEATTDRISWTSTTAIVGSSSPIWVDVTSECHIFVRQAQANVNNVMNLNFVAGPATKMSCMIEVVEYNSFGIEASKNGQYQQPIFIAPSTGTLVPFNQV